MEVIHYERARYRVLSHGEEFMVDLLAHNGNGQCDCMHFRTRLAPEIERLRTEGSFVPGPNTQCPHIAAADRDLLLMFKRSLAQQFPDTKNDQ